MHLNTPKCPGCDEKLKTITNEGLLAFAAAFRAANPDGHISCGYRDANAQNIAFQAGTSRAKAGQSPHNYGLALDWFRLTAAAGASFDKWWYEAKLAPAAQAAGLVWGGTWNSFKDFPHVETPDWRSAARASKIHDTIK